MIPRNKNKSMGQKLPICYKCKKPVDSFTREERPDIQTYIWTAECHGSKESVELGMEFLMNHTRLEAGYAFQSEEIEKTMPKDIEEKTINALRLLLNTKNGSLE